MLAEELISSFAGTGLFERGNLIDEEEEIREPITFNLTSFGIEGVAQLSFSETLLSLEELIEG